MNSFMKIKNWVKSSAFGLILTSIALVFVICVGLIVNQSRTVEVTKPTDNLVVEDSSFDSAEPTQQPTQEPVIAERIKLPFTVNATIARYFFESSDSIEIKSQSIINYDNKYIPSLGVDYIYENEAFEIVSSFEGIVVEKKNDALYGLSIVVENDEGLRAHYCGLSDVLVFEDDKVVQGQVIAHSGESLINANLGNHLHFAIEYQKSYLNPLKLYDKKIEDVIN